MSISIVRKEVRVIPSPNIVSLHKGEDGKIYGLGADGRWYEYVQPEVEGKRDA